MPVRVLAGISIALALVALGLGGWTLFLSKELETLRASFTAAQQEKAREIALLPYTKPE